MMTNARLPGLLAMAILIGSGWAGASLAAAPVAPGAIIQDCRDCPKLIVVPAGTAPIGSDPPERAQSGTPASFGDREGPITRVTIARPFALGRTEVTRGQYAAFVADTHHPDPPACGTHVAATDDWTPRPGFSWRDPGYAQDDTHPAVCIAYEDAVAYTAWLAAPVPFTRPSGSGW